MLMQRVAAYAVPVMRMAALRPIAAASAGAVRRSSSDNVTYSGGQEGVQGGFYGSGGARSKAAGNLHHRPEAVATLEDITRLTQIMQEVHGMETELSKAGFHVNAKTIELKSALKRTLSSPAMMELLNRLEINSEPVWGLTQKERELVREARIKVNTC